MDLEENGSHDAHPFQKFYKAVRIQCQVLIPDVSFLIAIEISLHHVVKAKYF